MRNGFIKVSEYYLKHKTDNVIPGCYCIDIITDEIEEEEDEYENEDNY